MSLFCDWPTALEPAAGFHMGYQRQNIRLFQASTEDVPVSMSGRLVAADSTSEEQFCRGSMANLTTLTLTYEVHANMFHFIAVSCLIH